MRRIEREGFLSLVCGLVGVGIGLATAQTACAQGPAAGMFRLTVDGRRVEGSPVAWDEQTIHLLARDGHLWEIPRQEARNVERTSDRFRTYPPSQFRAQLLRELGPDYEVSGTTHYVIAHPQGQRTQWAERFESLYRAFVRYFSVRGFQPEEPPYPLVGIVSANRDDFDRFSQQSGNRVSPNVRGYYEPQSNRILIYDQSGSGDGFAFWNNSVLIHEATHQVAFNTGVHRRTHPTPLWLAEGLATMFEAPGVYDASGHPNLEDRINRHRLAEFRRLVRQQHGKKVIPFVVSSDRLFRENPSIAYAEAWALTFYLVEKHPQAFASYLRKTADQPAFRDYLASDRLRDFVDCFGSDWEMLNARMLRFVDDLP